MKRISYYDNAKFILILSVILGHLFENNGLHDNISIGAFDTIFLYAMPSFIFVSGIFSPPRTGIITKNTIVKFLISELSLFEPLFIFSFILAIPTIISHGFSLSLLRPGYTLWYLLALIWWRLLVFLIPPSVMRYKYSILFLTLFISLCSGFISKGNCLAIPRTLYFLPFFWLGCCVAYKHEIIISYLNKIPSVIAIIGLFTILIMNTLLAYNQSNYSAGNVPYDHWNMTITQSLIWWGWFFIMRVGTSLCVLRLIPNKKNWCSEYGSKSLIIYVFHAVLLVLIMFVVNHLGLQKNLFMTIIEYLVVVPILLGITRLKFVRFAIAPFTYCLKK